MALAALSAGLSVASGLFSFGASQSAADKAKKLTRAQLWAHDADTAYNKNLMEDNMAYELGSIKASWGASNLQWKGTPKAMYSAVEQQLQAEIMNFEDQALAQRKAIRYGGKATESSIKNQGISSLIGSVGQAVGYFG